MIFNLYELTNDFKLEVLPNYELDNSIKKRLNIIENQITAEFIKKQEGKIGIKNLGNELRYNSVLKKEFNDCKDNRLIVKLTENRRSFIKVFIDNWVENNDKEIYFLIFEDAFGNSSNIVDNSFIRINEIVEELSCFNKYFRKTTLGPIVKFIEMKDFENYYLIDNIGYTSLQLKSK